MATVTVNCMRKRMKLWLLLGLIAVPCLGQQKRPVDAKDCVETRYPLDDSSFRSPLQLDPSERHLAYLVKVPNLRTNKNDIELHVVTLFSRGRNVDRILAVEPGIAQIQWLGDGRRVAMLMPMGKRLVVMTVDVFSGRHDVLARSDADIREYSVSADGDTVVFATEARPEGQAAVQTAAHSNSGYQISFDNADLTIYPKRKLFFTRRLAKGAWSVPRPITLQSPFTGYPLSSVPYQNALLLSLSPNGQKVTVRYISGTEMPDRWKADPNVSRALASGFPGTEILVIYNLQSGRTTLPFETTWTSSTPLWSSDSDSFLVVGHSPVASSWEHDDEQAHRLFSEAAYHLFWVEPRTGTVELVATQTADHTERQVVSWKAGGKLLLRTASDTLKIFEHVGATWRSVSQIDLPFTKGSIQHYIVGNERRMFGVSQAITTPPEIFSYEPTGNKLQIVTTLNPRLEEVELAPAQEIHWTTSNGFPIEGYMFLPPDYVPGKRYPVVIQTKPMSGQFACDSGQDHYPSFAPQPIANAGMIYIAQHIPDNWDAQKAEQFFPSGYPGKSGYGGLSEAAFQMDMWDRAVEMLDAKGLADRSNIGIIGFSRAGWYTEFSLIHSRIQYRAATVADNVQYSLGEYWLSNAGTRIKSWETLYGGPPYGPTLKNWLEYSISFNLDKIHTPLLMESMGNGHQYNDRNAPPLLLAYYFEVSTGLKRLEKPVELFYYPNEDHQPDDPKARLGTLQRNVDWYRFWLQGYERPKADDVDQYRRWEHLRELRDADAKP
jgi:dipeptidyl aminopeptidase/acylaminoacyl peptidase